MMYAQCNARAGKLQTMRSLLRRYWAVLGACVGVALVAALLWPSPHSAGKTETEKERAAAGDATKPLQIGAEDARRAGLVVNRLEPTPAVDAVELFGSVEVNKDRLARVVAPVAGRVARVNANLGDTVRTGDTLALIESSESGRRAQPTPRRKPSLRWHPAILNASAVSSPAVRSHARRSCRHAPNTTRRARH